MANIKWTAIESYKYGLTARWYVSAYYGNDIDVDGVGYYNPSTNVTGHGGPTRPFATLSKIMTDSNIAASSVCVFDSGYYSYPLQITKNITFVGDGNVVMYKLNTSYKSVYGYSVILIQCNGGAGEAATSNSFYDSYLIYHTLIGSTNGEFKRSVIIESTVQSINGNFNPTINNCVFINVSGDQSATTSIQNITNTLFINCSNFKINTSLNRPAGIIIDYNIIIGTVKSNRAINGKTTGVTIEDFKVDGNYFVKSFSEVDLFGNTSGSGASVAQLQTIFNNYFSPIYIDTYQDADLSLKPDVSDIVKFGGLNGTYIGALPVGYRITAYDLYYNLIDSGNSSNLDWDAVNNAIVIASGQDVAVYRSTRLTLPVAISCDPINFFANLVYNIEGTAKQGVANQRIDTTPDLEPDNTLNQRVVYDFKLAYAANDTDPLSDFKNFELNRVPYIDNEGESMLDDNYDPSERQKPIIRSLMIEFTLRKIIIA